MLRYVARRLLQMVPVFFGATLLIYAMVFALPGDPIAALGGQRSLSPEVIDQIKASYHLDKPFIVQYLLYLKGLFTLDLGQSLRGTESVLDVLVRAYPITIKLSLMALAFEAIAGIGFGLIAGVRKGGWFDATVLVLSLVVISVPTFVIGFLMQYFIGVKWGLLPTTVSNAVNIRSLTMPAIVLGATSLAYVIRLTRQSVSENVSADFVRTARAKGLPNGQVMSRHILRNSLIPVATFLGGDLGSLMGGAIITEGIFNVSGIGGTLWQAIIKGEPATVVSVTTVLVLVYILANLLVDLLYAVLDPRIRYE